MTGGWQVGAVEEGGEEHYSIFERQATLFPYDSSIHAQGGKVWPVKIRKKRKENNKNHEKDKEWKQTKKKERKKKPRKVKKKHYKEQRKMQNILNYELEKLSLIIYKKKPNEKKSFKPSHMPAYTQSD